MKIATHSGVFHSDDVFAVAVVFMRFGRDHEVVRTRDPEMFASADIVIDVGRVFDEAALRFDHHQGPPLRRNGIPYASFGLVWKKWGIDLAGSAEAMGHVDRRLVQPIDAGDNSVTIANNMFDDVAEYKVQDIIKSFRPTWLEPDDLDAAFLRSIEFAYAILEREIARAKAEVRAAAELARIHGTSAEKRILVLDKKYPHSRFVAEHPEILFVVSPDNDARTSWNAKAVGVREGSLENRKEFPEQWADKLGGELAAASGVPDAIFCHRARFIAVARSREGAVRLAELALEA